jgi:hypothetical protein
VKSSSHGSRKVGRHSRVVVKDTILRDEQGNVMSHMALFAAHLRAAAQGIHNPPQPRQKKAH